jgi:hypothetical protein
MSLKPLYIDDIRTPKTDKNWVVVRTSQEAIDYVIEYGCPTFVSFDHDLGGDDTSMIFLKWLIDWDITNDGKIIPEDFLWNIHSANPVGTKNIDGLLQNYINFKKK